MPSMSSATEPHGQLFSNIFSLKLVELIDVKPVAMEASYALQLEEVGHLGVGEMCSSPDSLCPLYKLGERCAGKW